ncbi:hypothetical protein GGI25_003971 [Coemansia spiralis]|uniref:Uncharacterized protein n=2 Tax=Coemansia TaxID=4863 RepID=A0A9W8G506_9FUNG|nr:hypothetical protein BX070DRAFT_234442 [Coemansia spiralis]KAJ1990767.1 hypothetical protein EDC05_003861 [Coemansia umbellata]KAJ2620889.1 hypothetical protein GGI26_004588 [Coemansia sp. RSA 1358]KAJ2675463.1 hypothetical protein GGI25_003971 [Coemansia spiralis]
MTTADKLGGSKKKKPASLMRFFGRQSSKEELNSNDFDNGDDATKTDKQRAESTPIEQTTPKNKKPATAGKNTENSSAGLTPTPSSLDFGTLVSFKNGKMFFAEKKLGLERHPSVIAAVFKFHQLIAHLKQEDSSGLPLTEIPSEHWPLLAMMVQERDATINTLIKSIEQQLCPVVFGEDRSSNSDILAHGAVENAILQIAEHKNYGPTLSELQKCCEIELEEIPSNLSIQRWEVRDISLLPEDVRDVVMKRRETRKNAQIQCIDWFQSLDADTQAQILAGTLKKLKIKGQSTSNKDGHPSDDFLANAPKAAHTLRGQRSIQTFFGTEKNQEKEKKIFTTAQLAEPKGFYESTFLPFHLRLNTEMHQYQRPASFDPTNIDKLLSGDDTGGYAPNHRDLLHIFVNTRKEIQTKRKSTPPVCEGVEIDEAEIQLLRLRQMPMKLLHFYGSRRPDYWGTWSKRLCKVSRRRPFAADTDQLDYEVDSDAEWEIEDDEEGEELHSDNEDEDDEDEDDEDFDEENGFIVGDRVAKPRSSNHKTLSGDAMDDDSDDSSDNSVFNSEDEEIEEIDPDEEVCADAMDVDDVKVSVSVKDNVCIPEMSKHTKTLSAEYSRYHVAKKTKQNSKQKRQKLVPLTPIVVGLVWSDDALNGQSSMDYISDAATSKSTMLAQLSVAAIGTNMPLCISVDPYDVLPSKSGNSNTGVSNGTKGGSMLGTPTRKGKAITDDDLFAIVSIVHGSSFGISKLVDEVRMRIPEATKAQIERLIHEHASKEKRPPATRHIWYVSRSLVEKAQIARKANPNSNKDINVDGIVEEQECLDFGNPHKRQRTDSNDNNS